MTTVPRHEKGWSHDYESLETADVTQEHNQRICLSFIRPYLVRENKVYAGFWHGSGGAWIIKSPSYYIVRCIGLTFDLEEIVRLHFFRKETYLVIKGIEFISSHLKFELLRFVYFIV